MEDTRHHRRAFDDQDAPGLRDRRDNRRRNGQNQRRQQTRWGWWFLGLWLPVSAAFSCHLPLSAEAELARASLLFQHGELERCQTLSALDAPKFRSSWPDMADRLDLLAAISAAWRGNTKEALEALSSIDSNRASPVVYVKKLALLGPILVDMQRPDEGQHMLALAETYCRQHENAGCIWVAGTKFTVAMRENHFPEAYQDAQQVLSQSRKFEDRFAEASSLLKLGHVCLEEERYDESLSWSNLAIQVASQLDARDIVQNAKANLAWAYFRLGDSDRALTLLHEAGATAASLGDTSDSIAWLIAAGYIHASRDEVAAARSAYDRAMAIASAVKSKQEQLNVLTDLGLVALAAGDAKQADAYARQSLSVASATNSLDDIADATAVQMQAAAMMGDSDRAERLLSSVEGNPESLSSMKWASEHALASLYDREGKSSQAEREFQKALITFEGARSQLSSDSSRLPFVANANAIYDDYINFLITQNKPDEALLTADQSRARTLAQGLGADLSSPSSRPAALHPQAIAQKANATLLFYWLGEKQSWLWAITPRKTALFPLPPQREITSLVERYRKALRGPTDPAQASDESGLALYNTLVAPAASMIPASSNVMILADGPLSLLNFETLLVPAKPSAEAGSQTTPPHYWIEDVNLVSAPSLAMLASAQPSARNDGKLLLLGDAISPEPSYPELPLASMEMQQIARHFPKTNLAVFTRQQANPSAYLSSTPQQYTYIHFVAHGVASRTDPLDSAIILSRSQTRTGSNAQTGEDSFKLYARDIMRHPIDARLVTISACYGSGTRSYVGEGLVGLSWAFLRAGAHTTIGALWEASDDSTPRLMDSLYQGLDHGQSPSAALRQAKLELLHSHSIFRRPFYWAPFQLYTRL